MPPSSFDRIAELEKSLVEIKNRFLVLMVDTTYLYTEIEDIKLRMMHPSHGEDNA